MITDDEGLSLLGVLKERFAPPERTQARKRAERRAGLTPAQRDAQRARKGPPKTQVNFRATAETKALIDALAQKLELSVTDVLALAIEQLAKAHNVKGDK